MNHASDPALRRPVATPPPPTPADAASAPRPTHAARPVQGGAAEGSRTRRHSGIGKVYGSYRTLALLGEGGMGQVFLAEHVRLGRKVALKLLKRRLVQRPEMLRQFFDEARAAGRIKHPNIVDVIDFVVDGDVAYTIMEYLPGKTLSQTLRLAGGALEPGRALHIAAEIADALQAAHDAGILHLDVKPSNILILEQEGQPDVVKLMDFGTARLLEEDDDEWAQRDTAPLFTPVYMSPEQGGGAAVDHRSDLYSLGVVLYEMLTGAPPFQASSLAEYCYKHMKEPPRRITQVRGLPFRIPRLAAAAVMRCLAKTAEERFPSMAALREVLLNPRMDSGRFRALSAGPGRRGARRRWPWIAAATASVAAGVVLAALVWPSGSASTPLTASLNVTAPAAPPAEEHAVVVQLRSDPSGAEVFDPGPPRRLIGLTPLTIRRPRSSEGRRLVIRFAGYGDRVIQVPLNQSSTLQVSLKEDAPVLAAPAPATRATAAAPPRTAATTARPAPRRRSASARRRAVAGERRRPSRAAATPARRRVHDDGTVDPFR